MLRARAPYDPCYLFVRVAMVTAVATRHRRRVSDEQATRCARSSSGVGLHLAEQKMGAE